MCLSCEHGEVPNSDGDFLGNKHVQEQRRDSFNAQVVLQGGSPIRKKGGISCQSQPQWQHCEGLEAESGCLGTKNRGETVCCLATSLLLSGWVQQQR